MIRSLLLSLSLALALPAPTVLAQGGNAAGNLRAAETFLAANAKKKGVVTLPSGLQFQVLRAGQGKKPTAASTVRVNYKGYFPSGRVFDQNKGIEFPLNGVIPAWTEGLQQIGAGGRIRLWAHPDIGYGPNGSPPVIPPNALLVFDVDLLAVK